VEVEAVELRCTVNGEPREVDGIWPGESLLYVLRERLGLPGAKNACEQGECGSCSVYLDGVLVCACLVAAGQAEGADIVTVEGLAAADPGATAADPAGLPGDASPGRAEPAGDRRLHPIQEAFLAAGAVQCGFCTPGLIVATHDLLRRNPSPDDGEIREALAGNLCRCTGYEKILDAVRAAAAAPGEPVR
jgi:aerobic carbon-monoxide dehydrogenase small subunit